MDAHTANEHEPITITDDGAEQETGQIAPGVPIVRASTPRSLSYFPSQAPAAPPLPEESETGPDTGRIATALLPSQAEQDEASEFAWLFEYGLEMDAAYLNGPERLDGSAKRYGPAMVKGYELRSIELADGRIAPTLVKRTHQDSEVWGILYRVPRRLLQREGTVPARLDSVHSTPAFAPVTIRAQETYRNRSIECVTYIASESNSQAFAVLPPEQRRLGRIYAQHLLRIGKQQSLPATYLAELAMNVDTPTKSESAQVREQQERFDSTTSNKTGEQNTEPLPALINERRADVVSSNAPREQEMPGIQSSRWLFALALYLVLLLIAALVLAVMQALGYIEQVFTSSIMPLGVPWYVLLYGLLGGCISGMMGLGRLPRHLSPTRSLPAFVLVTWFSRPYLGAVLAALAYFLLNSGLFLLSVVPSQRSASYAVIAAIAGMCEGRVFFHQK